MKKNIVLNCLLVPVALLATTVYAGNGWNIQTVDNSGDTGYYSSVAYDSQGYPHIVYYNSSTKSLMYTRWTGAGWQCETLLSSSSSAYSSHAFGQYCSIVIDDEDRPHIAYYHDRWEYYYGTGGSLDYTFRDYSGWHNTTVHWSGWHAYYGLHTSIAITRDPNLGIVVPHFAYRASHTGDLWHAWLDPNSLQWKQKLVDGAGNVGQYTSIALDDQQHIYISYYDAGGQDLKFAYYDGSQWSTQIIDSEGEVGKFTSLVLDDLGTVHITYYDETNGSLKHASLNLQ